MLRLKKMYRGIVTRVVTEQHEVVFNTYTKAEADAIVSNEAEAAGDHCFKRSIENSREYEVEELDN
jgi:hypothetical protein